MNHFKRYVILGGDGVFGIYMAKYLLEKTDAERVICVGRNPRKHPAYTLDVGKGDPRFKYYQIHLTFEQDFLFEMFDKEKPECIMNFAALAYATSWTKAYRYYETNVVALAKMTEEIRKRDYFKHWMQIGSSEVYGSSDKAPAREDTPPNPTSPYSVSKLAGDQHLLTYWNTLKFPTNIIRPSNAYAPGQQLYRVWPRAAYCAVTGQKLPLQGGGMVEKSYIHATDMARAIHLITEKAPRGKIYNAGTEKATKIRHLIKLTAQAAGLTFEQLADITPGRVGEDARYWLDSSEILKDCGWKPEIPLEQGADEMIAWARKYKDFLATEPLEYTLHA